jgi:hypothetical protein
MKKGKKIAKQQATEGVRGIHDKRVPAAGTVLKRVYKGKEIACTVRPDGFEFRGKLHRTLTNVAREVTGIKNLSGPNFWGLNPDKPVPVKAREASAPVAAKGKRGKAAKS